MAFSHSKNKNYYLYLTNLQLMIHTHFPILDNLRLIVGKRSYLITPAVALNGIHSECFGFALQEYIYETVSGMLHFTLQVFEHHLQMQTVTRHSSNLQT